jgi:hypothetical protein
MLKYSPKYEIIIGDPVDYDPNEQKTTVGVRRPIKEKTSQKSE